MTLRGVLKAQHTEHWFSFVRVSLLQTKFKLCSVGNRWIFFGFDVFLENGYPLAHLPGCDQSVLVHPEAKGTEAARHRKAMSLHSEVKRVSPI